MLAHWKSILVGSIAFCMSFAVTLPLHAQAPQPSRTATPTIASLQRAIDQRDAVIADLIRRMAAMEARMAAIRPQTPASPQAPSSPKDPPTPPLDAEDEGEVPATALERALTLQGGLVLPPGEIEVTPALSYTYSGSSFARLIEQVDATPQISAADVRRDTLATSLGIEVGLPWQIQAGLSAPYIYDRESDAFGPDRESAGIGDISFRFAKQFLREDGWIPDILGRVSWRATTGKDGELPLGADAPALIGSVTAVKSHDPLVYVGSIFYTHNFDYDQDGQKIKPGNSVGFDLSSILAVSPETSLRIGAGLTFIRETEAASREIRGSDRMIGSLELGATTVLTQNTALSVFGSFGFTEDAPDLSFGLALPYRF
jgi:hypothetical protein